MDASVVIPTRNRSALLALTLRSVLRQQHVDLEVIVVDDGSDDDTLEVVASFDDPRISVVRHRTPQGVSIARNRGLAEASAEWVAFVDDDDLWAPEKLHLQLEAARQTGATWVYAGHVNINVHHRVTGGAAPLDPVSLVRELPQHNVVPGGCSGVMVSKSAFLNAGQFDPQLQPLADWDLWLRLARTSRPACVPRPLVAYRVHGNQMSLEAGRVETEFAILTARNPDANAAILYRYLGWWALRVKNYRAALGFFGRAWRQRASAYTTVTFAGDLSFVVADAFEHRLGVPLRWLNRIDGLTDESRSWRAEGQAWVDALVAEPWRGTDRHAFEHLRP